MKPLTYNRDPGRFWVRLFGRGVLVKDMRRHRLLFSERYGYYRGFRVGPFLVRYLGRDR